MTWSAVAKQAFAQRTPEGRYRKLLDCSPAPICVHDGRVVRYVNPAMAQLLNARSAPEICQRPITQLIHEDSLNAFFAQSVGRPADGSASAPKKLVLVGVDGSHVWVQAVTSSRTRQGRRIYEVVVAPVTADRRLHAVLNALHQGVVIIDNKGRFEFTNDEARRMLGAAANDLAGDHYSDRAAALPLCDAHGEPIDANAHPLRFIQQTGVTLSGEVIGVNRPDGQRVWVTGHGCLLEPSDPQISSVLFSFTDITKHHAIRQHLWHDAMHDSLTGLPNRGYALERARSALDPTAASALSAVVFIDLDKLKAVNDSYGHTVGDDVLQIAAQRMHSVARPQDMLARLGGDEFVVLVLGRTDDHELETFARRLHGVFSDDFNIGPLTVRLAASIGMTRITANDGRDVNEILRDADTAMYRAKAKGPGNTAIFSRTE